MALPLPGEYKFLQKNKIRDRKSMLFVKLTDSAHRALSDYLKNQDTCGITPMIEFNKETGLILMPKTSKEASETETCMAHFKFNVVSNAAMQGQQGRFECIQHKRESNKIQKYGPLTKRLRIHASEDVFETTKNRMTEVNREQRKTCTREIDLNLETVNRQVKVDRNTKPGIRSATPNVSAIVAVENRFSKLPLHRTVKPRSKVQNNTTKLNSPISRKPLKERVIHMLAVRPLRKIEVSNVLRRDGLNNNDKAHLHSILTSVATIKDNVYHLLRHVWNDVQEDWPFYSEQEKQQMKRNKPQNLTPPTSDSGISTSSNLSPRNSSPGDHSPSYDYKRPGYIKGVDGLPTKRLRISHFNRGNSKSIPKFEIKNNESVHQIAASRVTNCFDEIIEKSGLSNTAMKNIPLKLNSKKPCNVNINSKKATMIDKSLTGKHMDIVPHSDMYISNDRTSVWCDRENNINAQSNIVEKDNGENSEMQVKKTGPFMQTSPLPKLSYGIPRNCATNSNDIPAYTKEYVTITDTDQRRQYKNDFLKYYDEYEILQGKVTPVHSLFIELKRTIRKHEKGSPEYSEMEQKIVQKYNETMNTNFLIMQEHYKYLHDKLSHIKQLVNEYDEKML